MTRNLRDLAEFGSHFDRALAHAIAQQEPGAAERIMAALERGDYEVQFEGKPPTITLRISGDVLLEAKLYREPADARLN